MFETLLRLVERAGHLVTKEELLAALWPDSVVEESNLAKNIWLIRRALGEAENQPRFIETLPRVGYRFLAPVERRTPAPRTARTRLEDELPLAGMAAAAAPAAGEGPAALVGVATAVPAPPSATTWRRIGLGAAGLGLAGLAVWGLVAHFRAAAPGGSSTAVSARVRRSVAVLEFQNLSGRAAANWLSTALSEMISADLAAGDQLRFVPAETVSRQRLPAAAGTLSPETLASLHTRLAADIVISGSYIVLPAPEGERIRLDVRAQDAMAGETLAAVSETGSETDLFSLVSAAGNSLRQGLGLLGATPDDVARVRASLPSDPEAARLYAEGLAKLRLDDAGAARRQFEEVIRREPDFPLAHRALSACWEALGYQKKARDEAAQAVALAGGLAREERLSLEGQLQEVSEQHESAVQTYRALFDFFPDDIEYGLRLAEDLVLAGRAREAFAVVDRLHKLPVPLGEDPRIEYSEATAAKLLGDWPRTIEAADRAIRGAMQRNAPQVAAKAWLARAHALDALGRNAEKRTADDEALRLFRDAGDLGGEADALMSLGNIAWTLGDPAEAERINAKVLSTYQQIGDQNGVAAALSNLSRLAWLRGDAAAARQKAESVLALRRELEDPPGTSWALVNLGEIVADSGEIEHALELEQEALDLARQVSDNDYIIYARSALGHTFVISGGLARADQEFNRALLLARTAGDSLNVPLRLIDRAMVAIHRGDLDSAERDAGEALAMQQKDNLPDDAAASRSVLARIALQKKSFGSAEATARQAAEQFRREGFAPSEAVARATLAGALLGSGDRREALAESAAALALIEHVNENWAVVPVVLAAARIEAVAGSATRAGELLAEAGKRASQAGWRASILEVRLVENEIDQPANGAAACGRLRSLATEAKSQGFGSIAQQAEHLMVTRCAT